MRKLILPAFAPLFFVLISFSFTASAQTKQQSDSLNVKVGGVIRSLTGISGFIKNIHGRWISSPGRIPFADPDYNNEYYDKFPLGTENLRSMYIRNISVAGKPYYALVVNYLKGFEKEKKDPKGKVIETTWHNYPALDYYIFPKEELQNLKIENLAWNKPTHVEIRFIYYGTFYNTNSSLQDKRIRERIEYNVVYDHSRDTTMNSYFQFSVMPVSNKSGKYIKFNTLLTYTQKGKEPELPDYDIFSTQYFQVPYQRWLQFTK